MKEAERISKQQAELLEENNIATTVIDGIAISDYMSFVVKHVKNFEEA